MVEAGTHVLRVAELCARHVHANVVEADLERDFRHPVEPAFVSPESGRRRERL